MKRMTREASRRVECGAVLVALATIGCDGGAQQLGAGSTAVEARLTVPSGMSVTTFAKVPGARFMTLAPDGSVYVTQPRGGRVVRLVDADGDGVAESQSVVLTGLNQPHGMAFHKGAFYVANTDGVVSVAVGASGVPAGEPTYVNHVSGGSGHSTRTIVFGPDSAMYVSVGSSCNLCEETQPDRATVMRFDESGANGRVFSKGLRNAVGVAVNPATKAIWVTQNERDQIQPSHEDLPPEEINILADGGDYGWPYCYGDRVPNPEYADQARCNRTVAPALKLQAHSAPLGISFLNRATKLPASLRGDALVAFHGSWNRDVPTGAKVVRVANGKPTGVEDFVTGWQDAHGRRWGRPADVLVARDGAVLITDDQSGTVYRVTAAGAK
jgi:glucose/arabinose dehydrogenase